MAKIYGINGAMSGKLGNTVMSVRNGEQLARQYQPVVYNPNTPSQVASRAKLKLMSQISAVMAPVIAMPRNGAVSPRNLFVKTNYRAITYSADSASVVLTNIKLTRSVVSLPELNIGTETGAITASLVPTISLDVDRVIYVAFRKMSDGTLRFAGSEVVSIAGNHNTYAASIHVENLTDSYVIYAYAVRDNTENARVIFGDMQVPSAQTIANLIVTRTLTETDVTLTETKSAEFNPA